MVTVIADQCLKLIYFYINQHQHISVNTFMCRIKTISQSWRRYAQPTKSTFLTTGQRSSTKPFLSKRDLETVIHAFITSRLDYCNSLLIRVGQGTLSCLQLAQNAVAQFSNGRRKFNHITPVLASLYWLPIEFRIL